MGSSGTEGYGASADALVKQYESLDFADVHGDILHLFPATPGQVIDIGAGTGRDAAAFAERGHSVTAVAAAGTPGRGAAAARLLADHLDRRFAARSRPCMRWASATTSSC